MPAFVVRTLRVSRQGRLTDRTLVLFFSPGVSLSTWRHGGYADREVAYAVDLADGLGLGGVTLLTYGDRDDGDDEERVRVLANRRGLPLSVYRRALPLLHARDLRNAGLLKTAQVAGAPPAVAARRLTRTPLVVRSGYLWSEAATKHAGPGSRAARIAHRVERRAFFAADRVMVTTERLRRSVLAQYGIPPASVVVVPNFVDVHLFRPQPEAREPRRLVFVGRLAPEKNLLALVDAIAGVDGSRLTMIGDGPLAAEIERHATAAGVDLELLGTMPNESLPAQLARAEALVLPSLFEGHPKVVIEAMACGLPVIGADVPGINDLVHDGETGFLASPSVEGIRSAVQRAFGDAALMRHAGESAREVAVREFSRERVLELELESLAPLLSRHRGGR